MAAGVGPKKIASVRRVLAKDLDAAGAEMADKRTVKPFGRIRHGSQCQFQGVRYGRSEPCCDRRLVLRRRCANHHDDVELGAAVALVVPRTCWLYGRKTSRRRRTAVSSSRCCRSTPRLAPGTFDAVKDGLVDVSYVTASYTPARHILPLLPELPGGGATAEINSVAFSRIHWKHLHAVGEYKGVKLLGVFTHGPGQMFNTKRPINKVEDLAGMKIRSGGGISEQMARALGASAFVKPAPGILRAAEFGRSRRDVLPARIDHLLQARHGRQVRHAVSGRLL